MEEGRSLARLMRDTFGIKDHPTAHAPCRRLRRRRRCRCRLPERQFAVIYDAAAAAARAMTTESGGKLDSVPKYAFSSVTAAAAAARRKADISSRSSPEAPFICRSERRPRVPRRQDQALDSVVSRVSGSWEKS